jgi:hypothetical protein
MRTKEEIQKQDNSDVEAKKMTRKQALKKGGLIALSAATMMVLVSTPKTASASPAPPPAW